MTVESVLTLPGLRSEYSVLPAGTQPTATFEHQVGVAFSGHRRTVRQFDGRTVRFDAPPAAVYVTGAAPLHWLEVPDPTEALEMYPDTDLLERVAGRSVDIEPALAADDAIVFAVASRLRRAHLGLAPLDDLEAGALVHTLVRHLVRTYGHVEPTPFPTGRLSDGALRAVTDHVHAHLDAPIALDDLARAARLTPFHFARTFTATVGMTPHEFTTVRRMTAARDRLLRSTASVTDIANGVGYRNVGHFRRVFRAQFGVLPGDMRSHSRTARSDLP